MDSNITLNACAKVTRHVRTSAVPKITKEEHTKNFKKKIDFLINLKDSEQDLESVSIKLPYGWKLKNKKYEFGALRGKINENGENVLLFFNKNKKKKYIGVALTFPGKVSKQYIEKADGYIYKWKKEEVTITKLLGTLKASKIEDQIKQLLTECKNFLVMYTDKIKGD